jgi:hypothetical protein
VGRHAELLRQLLLAREERMAGSCHAVVLLLLPLMVFVRILEQLASQDTETASEEQFTSVLLLLFCRRNATAAAAAAAFAGGQVERPVLHSVLFAAGVGEGEAGMLSHLPLFNLRLFAVYFAVKAALLAPLAAETDRFALLPSFLGGETVERGAGAFSLKFPIVFLLACKKEKYF